MKKKQRFSRMKMLTFVIYLRMHNEGNVFWVFLVSDCLDHTLIHITIPNSLSFDSLLLIIQVKPNISFSLHTAILASGSVVKKLWRCGFNPWAGKIPWRRKWQPTPVFLPGKYHGHRSLAGCSTWCHKS